MELVLSLPRDERFVETARSVAAHAARQAGHDAAAAEAFARRVEAHIRESIEAGSPSEYLPVVIRHEDGPVEVLVNGHVLVLEA